MSALRALDPRAAARPALAPSLIVAGAAMTVLLGVSIPRHAAVCFELCGAAVLVGVVAKATRRWGPGVILGLLILGAVDALPGPDVETLNVVRTITLGDALIVLLVGVLISIGIAHPELRRHRSRHETLVRISAAVLIAFWLVAGLRAWLGYAIPLFNALFWGRMFLYFGLLTPLLVRALSVPRVRRVTLIVCAAGICLVSAAQVATVATGRALSLVVHLTRTGNVEGLIRLYSGADYLVPAGIPFGLGLVLFGATRRVRTIGGVILVFSAAAVAVELTRILYIALVVAVSVTSVLWFLVGDAAGRVGRIRGIQVTATLVAMVAALIFIQPAGISGSVVNGVVVRATSIFSDLSGSTTQDPDLTLRSLERADLEEYLGSSWLFGKGFLDPSYHYVPQVINGSIMNSDVGYLSAVTTIGVAGAVVLFLPFFYLILALAYLRLRRRVAAMTWLTYGSLAWLLTILISSVTVAPMLSPIGAVPSAAAVALACVCAADARRPGLNDETPAAGRLPAV